MEVNQLIEAGDLNGLLRAVDGLCASREWDALVDLRRRCLDAIERGKQLWPIAMHTEYRLALEAPGRWAGRILDQQTGRFSLGPLTEVAASTHSFEELIEYISDPPAAGYVAQERALRGEDLRDDPRAQPDVLELPLVLADWEPTYSLPIYRADHVEVPEPWDPKSPLEEMPVAETPDRVSDVVFEDALLELVHAWTAESNGAARAVVVEGTAHDAASALTFGRLRMGRLDLAEAFQVMAWAAASGGAYGRRRGGALGRFAAWHVGSLLVGFEGGEDPEGFGAALGDIDWWRWDEGAPEEGWILRLAIEDPTSGRAAALSASDVVEQ
ncbi:MAG TPA: DUF6183 family protein [Actinomycetota bacterium]|nr:DUF6183 family protein [Actinomycetota bacterium]